ncbi:hypothetical protein [Phenylobacterium sp.]|uniref:hypothetical protein n=1 Tax=Phenylobacterium sp. TaxID=1871053 RepID=UPI002DF62507|nr:hypothetical protein [Phenylobacterium sp.]
MSLLAGASAAALLAGCIGNPFGDAQIDPSSPVAPDVARIANANHPYPTFASIPAKPKDVRPVRQYGRDAQAIEQARADLERKTAPETWSLGDTEAFAAQAQRDAGREAAPQANGDTAAFADTQRKRATPPPPPPK